ncbi:2OG-Fe(II) oxygenase superfamily protein [compost metagenome]
MNNKNIEELVPVKYHEFFLPKAVADAAYEHLLHKLDWVHLDAAIPRREYYVHDLGLPYTYGTGTFARTYDSQPEDPVILMIRRLLKADLGVDFDVVFLNIYDHHRHQLGWHADDSPEMSDAHPIVTVSLGAERDIKFCRQEELKDSSKHYNVRLKHGSACVMLPGMQDTHFHRIPKHDRECGPRISLTFRVFVPQVTE